MSVKDDRLRAFCESQRIDGIVIRRRSNASWITNGADFHCDLASTTGIATLLWTPSRKMVFTDTIEAPRLRAEEPLSDWDLIATPWWEVDRALDENVRSGRYLSDVPDDLLQELRASLTSSELEAARALGRDAAEVVERLLMHDVKPGMTEWHLAGAIAGWLRDRGIVAHVVLIAADERIEKFRHPIPTSNKIRTMAMAAVCAQRNGLIVSLTRLVHFGALPEDLRRRHGAVCAVDRALHSATRPGARWCDVLSAGVAEYARQGFAEEWKLHHQGGPMGYECRDFKATPAETRVVQHDQLVGWNPTISGTKSEDTILSSGQVLTQTADWPLVGRRPDVLVR